MPVPWCRFTNWADGCWRHSTERSISVRARSRANNAPTGAAETVAELAACGRARWKIENETFNVLKTDGYNLEHNFGHGKKTLVSVLVTLNLLAFAYHTVSELCVLAWQNAMATWVARYHFFEQLRGITAHIVFPNWAELLATIANPKARPP